jgi:ketosteroid isomerase-like protein
MPIELENGCTEKDCSVDSDDPRLTNAVRRHFLEHFGHRDLDGMVSGYAENAIMVNVVNGERKSYRGHNEIREAFQGIFKLHPTVNSTFELKHIVVHDKNVMVVWSATTPTHIFLHSSDNFLFDDDGKIVKQFFNCQMNDLETPWYVDEE